MYNYPFLHQNQLSRESIFWGKVSDWWTKWVLRMLNFLLKTRQKAIISHGCTPHTNCCLLANKIKVSHCISQFYLHHSLFISEEIEECVFAVRCWLKYQEIFNLTDRESIQARPFNKTPWNLPLIRGVDVSNISVSFKLARSFLSKKCFTTEQLREDDELYSI